MHCQIRFVLAGLVWVVTFFCIFVCPTNHDYNYKSSSIKCLSSCEILFEFPINSQNLMAFILGPAPNGKVRLLFYPLPLGMFSVIASALFFKAFPKSVLIIFLPYQDTKNLVKLGPNWFSEKLAVLIWFCHQQGREGRVLQIWYCGLFVEIQKHDTSQEILGEFLRRSMEALDFACTSRQLALLTYPLLFLAFWATNPAFPGLGRMLSWRRERICAWRSQRVSEFQRKVTSVCHGNLSWEKELLSKLAVWNFKDHSHVGYIPLKINQIFDILR